MADLIEEVCRHTRPHCRGGDIQDFARQPADLAHSVLAFGIEEVDFGAIQALFSSRNARLVPVGAFDGLGNGTPWGKWIDRLDGSGEGKGRKRVVRASAWVGRRQDFGRQEFVKQGELSLLLLVDSSVLRLGGAMSAYGAGQNCDRLRTQFRLKQSCEQKKLSCTFALRQVGHCSAPASFLQSAPRQGRLVGAVGLASDILGGGRRAQRQVKQQRVYIRM